MNRCYRLIWNRARQLFVVASEISHGGGKTGRSRRLRRAAWLLPLGLSPLLGMAATVSGAMALTVQTPRSAMVGASASPRGGQVTAGSGHISQNGLTTTVDQHSQNLSLNWQSFNIGADSTVNFVQPGAQSIAVNRIADANASVILGQLNANGQVFLINPNGVLFGQGAQVNVGGLVASTLNMSDSELASGTRHFSGNGKGSIVNRGTINAAKGGYIALLGPQVTNHGTLHAPGGTAALAGGNAVTLSFDSNRLLSLQVDKSTLNALADNRQLIVADGGQVLMSAGAKDSLLASVVNNSGTIQARTVENRAGKIVLLGGMAAGTTKVAGTLDASAPTAGSGGFIETSAAHVQVAEGTRITTLAAGGASGTWLIDPVDFTIAASGGDMTGALLSNSLASADVTIQSTAGAGGTVGDINVNDQVNWSANQLTLNAQNNININADLNGSGTAKLALEYGQATADGTGSGYTLRGAQVNLAAGNNFSTKLGSGGAVVQYQVITSLGAAGSAAGTDLQGIQGNLTGNYVLGANIDASATSGWNGGVGFDPIAGAGTTFNGFFDGLGHTISGLTINRPVENEVGLFAVANGTALRNIGLPDSNITGSAYVGALVGNSQGATITDTWSSGVVGGYSYVGGLIGLSNGGYVVQAHSAAEVTGTSQLIGGLIGQARFYGSVSDSYATGNVNASGAHYVGGLIGQLRAVELSDSYATGAVAGSSTVGGLVGYLDFYSGRGTITGSYASGAVNGDIYSAGGLVGTASGTVVNSYWVKDTTGQDASAGGGIGLTAMQLIAALPTGFDAAVWGNGGNQTTPYLLNMAGNQVFNKNDLPTGAITTINRPNPYTVVIDVNHLQAVNGNLAGRYVLGADIDASATANWNGGEGFVPITGYTIDDDPGCFYDCIQTLPFTGTFDGLGHVISNLTINRPTESNVGLFGSIQSGAEVRNLGLVGGSISGLSQVGGLAGENKGTINNSYSTLDITGASSGGLVGINMGAISRSHATGNMIGSRSVGGLAGYNNALIDSSYSTGNVNGTYYLGGLVGMNESGGIIQNSYATGNVTGDYFVGNGDWGNGGLVGANSAQISNSYASGRVVDNIYNGGLIGSSGGSGTITNSYWNSTANTKGIGTNNNSATTTGLTATQMQTASNFAGFTFSSTPGATGNNWVMVDADGSLNNAGGTTGATRPMLASEYSTTINNAHQLQLMAMAPTASYILGSDIDAANTGLGNDVWGSTGFSSIGTFSGSFDGRNHVVSGLTVNKPDLSYRGLFAYANSSSTISNVGLVGGSVSGQSYGGSLAGRSEGAISNSYATGSVNGMSDSYAGGLVGWLMPGGSISNSYATGTVVSWGAGGLVGRNEGTISNSYASGAVSGTNSRGLVGLNTLGDVTDSFWNIDTTGRATSAGGVGLTTTEMMRLASFGNWDIANTGGSGAVWRIYEGHTAPLLTSFMKGLTLAGAPDVTTTYNGNVQSGASISAQDGVLGAAASGTHAGFYNGYYSAQQGYDISGGNLIIGKASLTLAAVTDSKTYDGTTASDGTVTVSGLMSGDDLTGLTQSFDTKNVQGTNGSTLSVDNGYALDDGNSGGNYSVNFTTAAGTIAAYVVDLSGHRIYDGTTIVKASDLQLGTLVGEETLRLSGSGSVTDKNVGTDKAVGLGSLVLGDGDSTSLASNYTLTGGTDTLTIDKATLTLAAVTDSKTYDGTTTSDGTVTASGLMSGDDLTGVTQSFDTKNVKGTNGSTLSVDGGYTLDDGNGGGNYIVDAAGTATGTISQATLTLTGLSAADKVYDTTKAATAAGQLAGVFDGDDVDAALTAHFADKRAGTGKTVTVDGITLSNTDAGNYVIDAGQTTSADILQRVITVEATGTDRVYDGTTVDAVSLASNGALSGDTVAFSGTGTFIDKNVGGGKTVNVSGIAASGTDAGNYSFNTTASTTADITPATLTYRADDAFFWTGQVPAGLGGAVTGLVGGDALADATDGTLVWSTSATSASPAGQYAIDGSGLSALNYVFAQAPGNATALRVANGSASRVVTATVAGLQQSETSLDDDAPALHAPNVNIVGGGVRLP